MDRKDILGMDFAQIEARYLAALIEKPALMNVAVQSDEADKMVREMQRLLKQGVTFRQVYDTIIIEKNN